MGERSVTKVLCKESLVTAFSPPQKKKMLSLEAQQTSPAHPTKEAVGPGDMLYWAATHKKKKSLREKLPVFLEFSTPTGIAMSLPMVMKERNLMAGFHHVYSLEKDPHAANCPDQLRSCMAAFHH